MKNITLTLAGLLLLSSCGLFRNTPASAPLTSRYAKIDKIPEQKDGNDAFIIVSAIANVNTPTGDTSSGKTIFNLQGEGQKALIEAYAKLYNSKPADFKAAMNTRYLPKPPPDETLDLSKQDVSITISVTRKDQNRKDQLIIALGDRVHQLDYTFKLDPALKGVRFKSWDKFKTQYGRFYVGSRSFTGNQELNINPSIPLTAGSVSLGNYNTKAQYVEQDTVVEQVVISNGILNDDNFLIKQTGTPKTSLLGNTVITLSIEAKNKTSASVFHFDNLSTVSGYNQPEDVKVKATKVIIPNLGAGQTELSGTLTCDYIYRKVVEGDKTYSESDDSIKYYYGAITQKVVLIKKDELKPLYFYVKNKTTQQYLQIQDKLNPLRWDKADPQHPKPVPEQLRFLSQDSADEFLAWLNGVYKSNNDIIFQKRFQLYLIDSKGELKPVTKISAITDLAVTDN